MSRILTSIQDNALPFFAHTGTLDGYKDSLQNYYDPSSIDCGFLETLCYIHVIQGNIHEAQEAATKIFTGPQQYDAESFGVLTSRVRQVIDLATSDVASAQNLLRGWAADTWREISKVGH